MAPIMTVIHNLCISVYYPGYRYSYTDDGIPCFLVFQKHMFEKGYKSFDVYDFKICSQNL